MTALPSQSFHFDALLLNQSGEMLLGVDPQTLLIVAANRKTVELLGYTPDELIGLPITELEGALVDVFYWEDVNQGAFREVSQVESLYRRRDGSMLPVMKDVRRLSAQGQDWLVLRVRDERERQSKEHALAALAAQLRATIEASGDGILVTDAQGHIVNMNRRFDSMWRIPQPILHGGEEALMAWIAAQVADPHTYKRGLKAAALDRKGEYFDVLKLADGRFFERRSLPQMSGDQVIGRVYSFNDISERKQADKVREEALSLLQKVASRVPGVMFQFRLRADGSSCVPYASDALRELYRVKPDEIREDAAPLFAVVHPDDVAQHLASIETSAKHLTPWCEEYRLQFAGEPDLWLMGNAIPQQETDGSVLWHGFVSNITERKQVEETLRIAATAFESQEGMLVTDAQQVILRVNRAFTDITGYAADEVVGRKTSMLKSGRQDAAFYAAMSAQLQQEGVWKGEIWNKRKDGEIYPVWLSVTTVKEDSGEATHYVGTIVDITQRKAAETEINDLAFYDPLTRLPNRRLLMNRLQHALAASARSAREGALLFIDLDDFKTLNDTRGHDVGDLLLQQVAQRITTCVREGDTVARLGGDEFVVMLENLSAIPQEAVTQTEAVGEKIRAILNQPYLLGTQPHSSSPSIGAAMFNEHHNSIDELLKRADVAMYQAKAAGRNTLRFFDPQMQAAITARATLEADLRQGLQHHQFLLHYQSQVDVSGRITGAEVLVRWQHPQHGRIAPADFIPLAEETGLILPLGHWVLQTACAQLVTWAATPALAHLTVAVNVSARQFHHADFVAQVLAVLDATGANPHRLKLELTESLLLKDVEDIIAKMAALKAKGVGFSLDDFGTGYSSLSYLKRLPLDQLKIDQSFVRDVLCDNNDAVIAKTIIALAQNLGLGVIAEGVETREQRDFLARSGCQAYQGYYFSRPLPLEQFEQMARGET